MAILLWKGSAGLMNWGVVTIWGFGVMREANDLLPQGWQSVQEGLLSSKDTQQNKILTNIDLIFTIEASSLSNCGEVGLLDLQGISTIKEALVEARRLYSSYIRTWLRYMHVHAYIFV